MPPSSDDEEQPENRGPRREDRRRERRPSRDRTTPLMGALALIPQFSGDAQKIRDFCKAVTSAGRLACCSNAQLAEVAKLKLAGAASDFLDTDPALEDAEWPELREALLIRFSKEPSAEESRTLFASREQAADESAREFLQDLRLIGHKTLRLRPDDPAGNRVRVDLLEEQILAKFLAGLKMDIRRSVHTRNPKSVQDALDAAEREETFLIVNNLPPSPTPAAPAVRRTDYPVPAPRSRRDHY